jgi:hypothetical protein
VPDTRTRSPTPSGPIWWPTSCDVHEAYEASIEDGTQVYMSLEAGLDADSLKERGRISPPSSSI